MKSDTKDPVISGDMINGDSNEGDLEIGKKLRTEYDIDKDFQIV
jgi:hypothetical protein